MKVFVPLMSQPSFSLTADVSIAVMSLPWFGSVKQPAEIMAPEAMAGRNLAFCSFDPWRMMISEAKSLSASAVPMPESLRQNSSTTSAFSRTPSPCPPNSSGK